MPKSSTTPPTVSDPPKTSPAVADLLGGPASTPSAPQSKQKNADPFAQWTSNGSTAQETKASFDQFDPFSTGNNNLYE